MITFLPKKEIFKDLQHPSTLSIFIFGGAILTALFVFLTCEIAREKAVFLVLQGFSGVKMMISGVPDTPRALYHFATYEVRLVLGHIYEPFAFEWLRFDLVKPPKWFHWQALLHPADWGSLIKQWTQPAHVAMEIPATFRDLPRTSIFTRIGDYIFQGQELKFYRLLEGETILIPAWAEPQVDRILNHLYDAQRISDIVWDTFVWSFIISVFTRTTYFHIIETSNQTKEQIRESLLNSCLLYIIFTALIVCCSSLVYSIFIRKYILETQKRLCIQLIVHFDTKTSENENSYLDFLEWLVF